MRTISALFLGLACLILPSRTFSQSKSIFDDDWKPPTKTTPTETRPVVPPDTTTPFKPPVQPPIEVQRKPPVIEAPVVPTAKAARPDNRRYDEVLQKVRMIFEKEYARTDVSGRKDLARILLIEAGKIQKNVDAKYVLLSESRDLSAGLGDSRACRDAIQQLEASHDVVAPALAADALLKLLPKVPNDKTVIGWGLETLDQLLVTDDYATAAKLAQAMTGPVSQARDAALTARFRTAQAHLGEYTRVAPSLDKLKSAPDDSAANLAAGRFYCFQKLDWAKGLPLLAKGSDPILKMLAAKDLASPEDAAAQLKVGHQWWDFAKDNPTIQDPLYIRAGYWYDKALPGLSDELDRVLAKKRLAELQTQIASRPQWNSAASGPKASSNPFTGLWEKKTMKGGIQYLVEADGKVDYLDRGKHIKWGKWRLENDALLIDWGDGQVERWGTPFNDVMRGKGYEAKRLRQAAVERPTQSTTAPQSGSVGGPGGNSGSIDLLAMIDLKTDVLAGKWKSEGPTIEYVSGEHGRVGIPYQPPQEYDFQIEFTRQAGRSGPYLIISTKRCAVFAGVGLALSHNTGIGVVQGKELWGQRLPLENGRRYVCKLSIRKDSVSLFIDGKLWVEHKSDLSDLTLKQLHNLGDYPLGIGVHLHSGVIFHSVTLTEVTGKGKKLR